MTENETPYYSNPGKMIRCRRRQKNITLIELAMKMGVSQAYLSRIELGDIKPTEEQIETMCSFIDGKL